MPEQYLVDADSPEEAARNVYDGECLVSEVEIGDVVGVTRDKDFDDCPESGSARLPQAMIVALLAALIWLGLTIVTGVNLERSLTGALDWVRVWALAIGEGL